MEDRNLTLRAIVVQDGDLWAAQCLEYDIGAQGRTLEESIERLSFAIRAECAESVERSGTEFAGIPAAPGEFEEMWNRRAGAFHPVSALADKNVEYALCA